MMSYELCYNKEAAPYQSPFIKRADQCAGNALIGPNTSRKGTPMTRLRYLTDSTPHIANSHGKPLTKSGAISRSAVQL
jgi:hypothetical protein